MFGGFFSTTKAPEFPEGLEWVNTDTPLTLAALRGNVVVLDFWTYCCINCMHTLPTLAQLEEKYKDRPVVFIGVHSGKFFSEQDPANVKAAVMRYQIEHPVVVDERMRVWSHFGINAWPTILVIDPAGNVVYKQAGEGQKEVISDVIDVLLEKHSSRGTLAREPPKIMNSIQHHERLLSFPGKIAISKFGKIAISDSDHNRIIIADTSGKIEQVVGSGIAGLSDGDMSSARFFRPQGVAWGNEGLYVADTENHAIRLVDLAENKVMTVAGTGRQGSWASLGGNGISTSISSPWDVACKDDLVFVAMAGSHQIWTYHTITKQIMPFAGTGQENIIDGPITSAQLAQPSGIFILGSSVYFADSEVSAVRRIDLQTNSVSTIVGQGLFEFGHQDGELNTALFQHPLGLCATEELIFVADTYNSSIRAIDLKKSQVFTLVGKTDKNTACLPDDTTCEILALYEPSDVKLHDHKLYIADTNNHLVRIFDLQTNALGVFDLRL